MLRKTAITITNFHRLVYKLCIEDNHSCEIFLDLQKSRIPILKIFILLKLQSDIIYLPNSKSRFISIVKILFSKLAKKKIIFYTDGLYDLSVQSQINNKILLAKKIYLAKKEAKNIIFIEKNNFINKYSKILLNILACFKLNIFYKSHPNFRKNGENNLNIKLLDNLNFYLNNSYFIGPPSNMFFEMWLRGVCISRMIIVDDESSSLYLNFYNENNFIILKKNELNKIIDIIKL
jgi:hypothetical protein